MTSAPFVPRACASPSAAGICVNLGWMPRAASAILASTCEVREAVSR
jgi:hypothetical protein